MAGVHLGPGKQIGTAGPAHYPLLRDRRAYPLQPGQNDQLPIQQSDGMVRGCPRNWVDPYRVPFQGHNSTDWAKRPLRVEGDDEELAAALDAVTLTTPK